MTSVGPVEMLYARAFEKQDDMARVGDLLRVDANGESEVTFPVWRRAIVLPDPYD